MTSHRSTATAPGRPRRTARSIAAVVAAAGAATAASVALGAGPQVAQADPGDTYVPLGSSQLVQSEDLAAIQVPLDTERVVINRDPDLADCLGAGHRWTSVVTGSSRPITGTWTSSAGGRRALTESIAQAGSAEQATDFADTLLHSVVRPCRGHRHAVHYGRVHTDPVGSGTASWALAYAGSDPRPTGGVVVIRKGTGVGFVTVHGTWGPADPTLESVAKVAVDRLI